MRSRRSTPTPARTRSGGRRELGYDITPGRFGENLSTAGLDVTGARDRRALAGRHRRAGPRGQQPPRPVQDLPGLDGRAALGQAVHRARRARCLPARRLGRHGRPRGTRSRSCTARTTGSPSGRCCSIRQVDDERLLAALQGPGRARQDGRRDRAGPGGTGPHRLTPRVDGRPTLGPCPRPCPTASRRPPTARCPPSAHAASASAPFGVLPARAVLRDPLRLLRLQHLHGHRARRGGASRATTPTTAVGEIAAGPRGCSATRTLPVQTVFFGGGTPTLLPAGDLGADAGRGARRVRARPTAPRSRPRRTPTRSTAESLAALREAGFTRVSFGMQSAVPHVLAALDRTHDPGASPRGGRRARGGGLRARQPRPHLRHAGGVARRLARSLDAAIALPARPRQRVRPDRRGRHRLAARVRRGELPAPDDDDLADKYLLADELLGAAGLDWYEVSATGPRADAALPAQPASTGAATTGGASAPARTATSAARGGGTCKHPAAYAARLADGASPAHAREQLTDDDRRSSGCCSASGSSRDTRSRTCTTAGARRGQPPGRRRAAGPRATPTAAPRSRLRGRLLADAVVR